MTIRRLIVPIVINAVNHHPKRLLTHVSKEVLKTVTPFPAYANPASAIIFPTFSFWICAALNYASPAFIRSCSYASVSMFKLGRSIAQPHEAAATSRIALNHIARRNNREIAAIARTQPANVVRFKPSRPLSNQASEALTSQISEFRHA